MRTEAIDSLLALQYRHLFEKTFAARMRGAIDAGVDFSTAIAAIPPLTTQFSNTALSRKFRMIALTIAARQALCMKRQTFFVEFGGWDHHDEVVLNQEAMLPVVSRALSEFHSALVELDVVGEVTTFTASDFGRTLSSNGRGSDHAWGGNHLVMGRAVAGGDIYGQLSEPVPEQPAGHGPRAPHPDHVGGRVCGAARALVRRAEGGPSARSSEHRPVLVAGLADASAGRGKRAAAIRQGAHEMTWKTREGGTGRRGCSCWHRGGARPRRGIVADVPTFTLTFGRSVLNQLTFDTYRTPFDELQTRPYNMLFANIGRQPNFGAWPGQQGSYARYVDGLIGNNGAANVDNDADAIAGNDDPARDGIARLGDLAGVSGRHAGKRRHLRRLDVLGRRTT